MIRRKGVNIKALLALIFLIIIMAGLLYILISKERCLSQGCFLNSLWKCKEVTFTNAQENSTWYYSIKGVSADKCEVYVEVKRLVTDAETSAALTGKSMMCDVPKDLAGSFMPESKIEYCHGLLKESIQDLIIKRMHLFIVQNIGQINQSSVAKVV
jgi:hypothetical protein